MNPFEKLGLSPLAHQQLGKGQSLFHMGDPIARMYFIRQGRIRLVRHLEDGTPIPFHLAAANQMFAEASLFTDHYHCDAIAEEDCSLDVYSKPQLLAAFQGDPKAALSFMAHLAQQVQALRSQIELINIKSATQRVFTYIQGKVPPGDRELTLPQSWKSVAAEIGLTHEALYRALAELQKSKRIERKGRQVRLC
ncbi:MAG: Crp/Fnr family transcriptional regulator [Rhodospirillales bacterium]|nr:Crp/Fnr family transcriptional regulator [Rhodospirillales bacterium]